MSAFAHPSLAPLALASAVALLATLVPTEASAASTSPLSSLSALPKPAALEIPTATTSVPGLVLKTTEQRSSKWHELRSATGRGYCMEIDQGTGRQWTGTFGASDRGEATELALLRLVEGGEKTSLERTTVKFEPSSAEVVATGRSTVELREISRQNGVVVWAYRDGRDVVVIVRNVERGTEARKPTGEESEPSFPFISIDGCPFGGAHLDARKIDRGTFAQLVGSLPAKGTGKDKVTPKFTVDASLSRVTRDPEARIAIRVRVTD